MKLWLLRHGEAEAHARSDALRELTHHGRKEVKRSAQRLLGRPLVLIVASPYVRAQQTALLVREVLDIHPEIRTVPWLTPDSDIQQALQALGELPDGEVLLVTHQPLVGELAGFLVHGHRQQPLPMKTASLAELEGEMAIPGAMALCSLKHPD